MENSGIRATGDTEGNMTKSEVGYISDIIYDDKTTVTQNSAGRNESGKTNSEQDYLSPLKIKIRKYVLSKNVKGI